MLCTICERIFDADEFNECPKCGCVVDLKRAYCEKHQVNFSTIKGCRECNEERLDNSSSS